MDRNDGTRVAVATFVRQLAENRKRIDNITWAHTKEYVQYLCLYLKLSYNIVQAKPFDLEHNLYSGDKQSAIFDSVKTY